MTIKDVTYLTVPFKDKDIVKALGARWDGKNRQWFISKDQESRFQRWVKRSEDELVAPKVFGPDLPGEMVPSRVPVSTERVGASLSSILFEVSESVRRAWPATRWVIAELASIRVHQSSGHIYLELVEHDSSGREIAKANARVWAANAKILKKFEREAGGPLSTGMKVMVAVQADFSIQYGFGMTIDDIDPSWTIGDMQRKVIEIRNRLAVEGIFDSNKHLAKPRDFTKVALVAPSGAAGLGDFMVDANRLAREGLCEFQLIPAVFEGAGALVSLVSAFALAADLAERNEVDAVVVVRGGGAKTSLNWLNEYEIARQVCVMKVPVLVGVGHERDTTILDEIACETFDTPSKVIAAIHARVVDGAMRALASFDKVMVNANHACTASKSSLDSLLGGLCSGAFNMVKQESEALLTERENVYYFASQQIKEAKGDIEVAVRDVVGLGPKSTMQRGYCVAKQNGKAISRGALLDKSCEVELMMSDGIFKVGGLNE